MTTNEVIAKCEKYNKTFVGLARAYEVTMILDEILMPFEIPNFLRPMYPVKAALTMVIEQKIKEFGRFEEEYHEEAKKMEEIKKTAIPID